MKGSVRSRHVVPILAVIERQRKRKEKESERDRERADVTSHAAAIVVECMQYSVKGAG